ncbi:Centrosomal protein of 57 kDa [Collichthys lucidus]|uniref:Centrosomal protein of 57 kDa n=1 Tax=Collichthys lucidus TaxID=240159 RepID=A0A4V6ARH6_COLLU|nr:Centrosomal protein of 57 kDa [Collichthys lucidus]
MDPLSKTSAADATREKELCPPAPSGDTLSLPSYKEYPAHRPFINSLVHHKPQTRTHHTSYRPSSPSKALPETSSAAILSALRNLQEKIRRLELEKGHTELSLHTMGKDSSRTHLQSDKVTQRLFNDKANAEGEISSQSNCNQVLITHLAAAESRCVKLERQLDHMRRMLRNAKADKTSLLKQQVTMETDKSADQQCDTVSEHAQLEKLERLEQEYLRLTRTQNNAEMKIRQLEIKLQEEEHQRKLVQDKANQTVQREEVQFKVSRMQSLSPCKRPVSFSLFLKRHQPHLCNSRVLANGYETGSPRHSDTSSSSSSTSEEELSELLQALQEELRLMSLEQDELMRQVEDSVSEQERKELQSEQERLLLKMERKGEQISKLYKHKTQIKKLRKEANYRPNSGSEVKVTTTVSTRRSLCRSSQSETRRAKQEEPEAAERHEGSADLITDLNPTRT